MNTVLASTIETSEQETFLCSETHELMIRHQNTIDTFQRLRSQSQHYPKHRMLGSLDDILQEANVVLIALKKSHTYRVTDNDYKTFKASVMPYELLLESYKRERDIAHSYSRNQYMDIGRFL